MTALAPLSPPSRIPALHILRLCGGALVVLTLWIYFFPYTGDGDSIIHFLNALAVRDHIEQGLQAFSRPLYKLPMALFAVYGIAVARMFNACITLICIWQTVRLAEDLGLRRPLAAGVMMLFQPTAFALAADTMTEIPMATGIVIAVRLWVNRRYEWSGLAVGFLPMLRPEGFFLGLLWGIMLLFTPSISWPRKIRTAALMTVGLVLWSVASRIYAHDWFWVVTKWDWPVQVVAYGSGPIWYYAARFPECCGIPLFVFFVTGLISFCRGKTARPRGLLLAITIWALVLLIHTILFWQGLFASCGVLRILACTAPMVAVVGLHGYNVAADYLARKRPRQANHIQSNATLSIVLLVIALWGVGQYFIYGEHFDCFPMIRCAKYIQTKQLLKPGTDQIFYSGNKVMLGALGLPFHGPQIMEDPWKVPTLRAELTELPPGSLVVWDNRQSQRWYNMSIEDIVACNYALLDEEKGMAYTLKVLDGGEIRFVVLQKLP